MFTHVKGVTSAHADSARPISTHKTGVQRDDLLPTAGLNGQSSSQFTFGEVKPVIVTNEAI